MGLQSSPLLTQEGAVAAGGAGQERGFFWTSSSEGLTHHKACILLSGLKKIRFEIVGIYGLEHNMFQVPEDSAGNYGGGLINTF